MKPRAVHPAKQRTVGVIFSRDRAMQLDAMLRSLLRHCADPSLPRLYVLYAASSPQFRRQYAVLERYWRNLLPITFHVERQFRSDLLGILGLPLSPDRVPGSPLGRAVHRLSGLRGLVSFVAKPWEFVVFLVDDLVFVRRFSLGHAVQALRSRPQAIGFSLRLGRNTTMCYALDCPQTLPPFTPVEGGIMVFDWTAADCDFGYPLELSSSIYTASTVAGLLSAEEYSNPNTLESRMWVAAADFKMKGRQPALLCYTESVAFCNAVNRVQTTFENRSGDSSGLSATALANSFDSGLRIDTDALSGFTPIACHDDTPFTFVNGSSEDDGQSPCGNDERERQRGDALEVCESTALTTCHRDSTGTPED